MSRFILPFQSVFDANGHPLDGAKLYFYETGTSTPKDTYSNAARTTANANPVIANSQGEFGDIFLKGIYRAELKDKNDITQPNYPADSLTGALSNPVVSIAELRLVEGRSNERITTLGYYSEGDGGDGTFYWDSSSTSTDNNGTIIKATGVTTGRWLRVIGDNISVESFGAKRDGTSDASTAIFQAIEYAFSNDLDVVGSGDFLISSTVYTRLYYPTAHLENRATKRITLKGTIRTGTSSYAFILQSSGIELNIEKYIQDSGNGGLVKVVDSGYVKIVVKDVIGKGSLSSGILLAGCFDCEVTGGSIIGFTACYKQRASISGTDDISFTQADGSTYSYTAQDLPCNNNIIGIRRVGGDFTASATDSLSAIKGIHLEDSKATFIDGVNVEYCVRTSASQGIYIADSARGTYGVVYLESNNKNHIECYGLDTNLKVLWMATNRVNTEDLYIRGSNNTIEIVSRRTKDANDFQTTTTEQGRINVSGNNKVSSIPDVIELGKVGNRLHYPQDLSNAAWGKTSPTSGSSYPILTKVFNSDLYAMGGSQCSNLVCQDTNIYQYGQSTTIPSSTSCTIGLMVRHVSGNTRVMLKYSDGTLVRYSEISLTGSYDGWQVVKIDVYAPTTTPQLLVLVEGEASSEIQIANLYCVADNVVSTSFKDYDTSRPLSLGGVRGETLFPTIRNDGIIAHAMYRYGTLIANISIETLEYSIYRFGGTNDATTRVVTLPDLSDVVVGTMVTIYKSNTASTGAISLQPASGNVFSDADVAKVLQSAGASIQLIADSTSSTWVVLSEFNVT